MNNYRKKSETRKKERTATEENVMKKYVLNVYEREDNALKAIIYLEYTDEEVVQLKQLIIETYNAIREDGFEEAETIEHVIDSAQNFDLAILKDKNEELDSLLFDRYDYETLAAPSIDLDHCC